MISHPTLVAQPTAGAPAGEAADAVTSLLSGAAVQAFSIGVNTALLAALAARGNDVVTLDVQRRLQAYAAAPRGASAAKLRRYA